MGNSSDPAAPTPQASRSTPDKNPQAGRNAAHVARRGVVRISRLRHAPRRLTQVVTPTTVAVIGTPARATRETAAEEEYAARTRATRPSSGRVSTAQSLQGRTGARASPVLRRPPPAAVTCAGRRTFEDAEDTAVSRCAPPTPSSVTSAALFPAPARRVDQAARPPVPAVTRTTTSPSTVTRDCRSIPGQKG